jgi:hypothetical protein
MPHCIDTAVYTMKVPRRETALDRSLTAPQATELIDRHHSMLLGSDLGDTSVALGELLTHYRG